MHTLIAFLVALAVVSVLGIRFRVMPFISLIVSSLLYGVLVGMDLERILAAITAGTGRIFGLFGIVIFCGAVIAEVLREGGYLQRILDDIRRIAKRPVHTSGVAGYLLAVPLMCSITAFIILTPIVTCLSEGGGKKFALYAAAAGSVISFVLLYPAPVVYGITAGLGIFSTSAWWIDAATIPISIVLLLVVFLFFRSLGREDELPATGCTDTGNRSFLKAWSPILIPLAMFVTGNAIAPARVLANVNLALLAGLATALWITSPALRTEAVHKGTRHAGIILFDLCGAGAFGGVIIAGGFSQEAYQILAGALPLVVLPFALAVLLQTAQGSRVTTAVVTAEILGTTTIAAQINPFALLLLICAGCCLFSYASDPYFWLVRRFTGDEVHTVVRYYTLPLALIGCILLCIAIGVQWISAGFL